jgi:hypothetical protein
MYLKIFLDSTDHMYKGGTKLKKKQIMITGKIEDVVGDVVKFVKRMLEIKTSSWTQKTPYIRITSNKPSVDKKKVLKSILDKTFTKSKLVPLVVLGAPTNKSMILRSEEMIRKIIENRLFVLHLFEEEFRVSQIAPAKVMIRACLAPSQVVHDLWGQFLCNEKEKRGLERERKKPKTEEDAFSVFILDWANQVGTNKTVKLWTSGEKSLRDMVISRVQAVNQDSTLGIELRLRAYCPNGRIPEALLKTPSLLQKAKAERKALLDLSYEQEYDGPIVCTYTLQWDQEAVSLAFVPPSNVFVDECYTKTRDFMCDLLNAKAAKSVLYLLFQPERSFFGGEEEKKITRFYLYGKHTDEEYNAAMNNAIKTAKANGYANSLRTEKMGDRVSALSLKTRRASHMFGPKPRLIKYRVNRLSDPDTDETEMVLISCVDSVMHSDKK